MYSSVLREHRQKSIQNKKHIERLRADALSSVESVSSCIFQDVSAGATQVYKNQKALQAMAQDLQQQTAKMAKQTDQWVNLTSILHTSLKELGDVRHWAWVIHEDLKLIDQQMQIQAGKVRSLKELREREEINKKNAKEEEEKRKKQEAEEKRRKQEEEKERRRIQQLEKQVLAQQYREAQKKGLPLPTSQSITSSSSSANANQHTHVQSSLDEQQEQHDYESVAADTEELP